jgi:hypothetical protein
MGGTSLLTLALSSLISCDVQVPCLLLSVHIVTVIDCLVRVLFRMVFIMHKC